MNWISNVVVCIQGIDGQIAKVNYVRKKLHSHTWHQGAHPYGSRRECPALILHLRSTPPAAESPCAAESSLHGLGIPGVSLVAMVQKVAGTDIFICADEPSYSISACSRALRQMRFLVMLGAGRVVGLPDLWERSGFVGARK
jgi:hypothetical protein